MTGRARTRLVPLVLLSILALVLPASAIAATETTSTSGYNQEAPKPKEEKKPEKETSPSKESEPTKEPAAKAEPEAKTLPFTGFDLRWSVIAGVLLIGSGVAIIVMQQRSRRREQG